MQSGQSSCRGRGVTVAHLSLGIGANDLQVPGGHEESLLLLRRGLVQERGQKHPQVQVQGYGAPTVYTAKAESSEGCKGGGQGPGGIF